MTTKCAATAIKEDLLEHARGEAAALRPEHLWHLESCAHCRAALERMRRLARTWRALDPTPREIAAARARFAVRRRRRQAVRLAPAVAALAVLLAGAAASAAAARAVALTLAHWVHR
ncbi:MAG TPA: hypothetical protein VE987_00400, partial [Polyangiaceae bacterium]|nr:hypothetical protein [Polyangiaceae bacterium]